VHERLWRPDDPPLQQPQEWGPWHTAVCPPRNTSTLALPSAGRVAPLLPTCHVRIQVADYWHALCLVHSASCKGARCAQLLVSRTSRVSCSRALRPVCLRQAEAHVECEHSRFPTSSCTCTPASIWPSARLLIPPELVHLLHPPHPVTCLVKLGHTSASAQGDFDGLARGLNGAKAPAEQQNGRSSAREELYGALLHPYSATRRPCLWLACCTLNMPRVHLADAFGLDDMLQMTLRSALMYFTFQMHASRQDSKHSLCCGVAVGSRVKYLVDTPEMIWGCLDLKDYQAAAQRFLGCERPPLLAPSMRLLPRSSAHAVLLPAEPPMALKVASWCGFATAWGCLVLRIIACCHAGHRRCTSC